MIRKLLKLIFGIIMALILAGILVWTLSVLNLGKVSDLARDIRQSVEQTFAPEKQAAEEAVSEQAQRIAQEFGLDESQVAEFLEKHHIEGLEVIDLPEGAVVQKTVEKTFLSIPVSVTLYRDPGYITIGYQDKVVTFSVPEKTQKYISLWALS